MTTFNFWCCERICLHPILTSQSVDQNDARWVVSHVNHYSVNYFVSACNIQLTTQLNTNITMDFLIFNSCRIQQASDLFIPKSYNIFRCSNLYDDCLQSTEAI